MADYVARGLSADWLNAWLAAVGVTVVAPEVRLAWTDDPVPRARFTTPGDQSLAALVADALPTVERVTAMAFAGIAQKVTIDRYREAVDVARLRRDDTLGVLVTDLAERSPDGALPKGNFNVGMEGKESLDRRLLRCRRDLPAGAGLAAVVDETFQGRGRRTSANGLGFDYRRLAGPFPEEAQRTADPLIECLCFYGTTLFPVRGDGRNARQRGWVARSTMRHAFRWPVWAAPLDRWAIDSLLDITYAKQAPAGRPWPQWRATMAEWGVTGLYGTVPFEKTGKSVTKAYAAERLA